MVKENIIHPNSQHYADVALNLPIGELFTYQIPESLLERVQVGSRVQVPFRHRKLVGIVMSFREKSPYKDTKEILACMDSFPVINPELMQLTSWVSEYYQCSPGEAVHAAVPALGKGRKTKNMEIPDSVEILKSYQYESSGHLPPTDEQKTALEDIYQGIDAHKFKVVLLYGVTGSGKTEIYLQSIAKVLEAKKNALILVPEIALTYQLIQRFKQRFGEIVAVLHSGLKGRERTNEWLKIHRGEARVVVGVRSAVFAPVRNLGILIIDEEHETTFKQDNAPRFHARDVAIMRGQINHAMVILGSATPSMESYYNSLHKKYERIELTKRMDQCFMPTCKVIDMRQEWDVSNGNAVISTTMQESITQRIAAKEQVILFLNRRGYSSILLCRGCGKSIVCNHCSVPLTYHRVTEKAHCHYCGLRYAIPKQCEHCKGEVIRYLGLGTQQVESELHKLFPDARVSRLDMDVTKKRGEYENVLEQFIKGETDILLGTQMIAKGIDIPNVTLVGVIDADMMLSIPDFRSAERAYGLITQVSGRSGRGTKPGEVLIQTYNSSHYALNAAVHGERHKFYERELRYRSKLQFPPYRRLMLLQIQHRESAHCLSVAQHIAFIAKEKCRDEEYSMVDYLGPAAASIFKIKDKFRYQVILRSANSIKLREVYQCIMEQLPQQIKLSGAEITVDMDPLSIG